MNAKARRYENFKELTNGWGMQTSLAKFLDGSFGKRQFLTQSKISKIRKGLYLDPSTARHIERGFGLPDLTFDFVTIPELRAAGVNVWRLRGFDLEVRKGYQGVLALLILARSQS